MGRDEAPVAYPLFIKIDFVLNYVPARINFKKEKKDTVSPDWICLCWAITSQACECLLLC